jgi:dTDP-4-amino-4,6-dideoxygalactose transaminase
LSPAPRPSPLQGEGEERVELTDLAALDRELGPALRAAVDAVAASGRFVLGPEVEAFEAALAARWGLGHAVGVASGSDALFLALQAAGVGAGDVVVTTPLGFIASAEAILRVGALPRFVDVEAGTLCLAPAALARYLESCRRGAPHPGPFGGREIVDADSRRPVRAVMPVHLYGRACSAEIGRVARAAGLVVVHDAAQAVCARDAVGPVGRDGCACVSFHPKKNLGAWGDGGAILTDDAELAERVRRLRVHGRDDAGHASVGTNSRLDAIQAAVLRAKLGWIDQHEARRRANAGRLHAELAALAPLVRRPPPLAAGDVCHLYTVEAERRDELRRWLDARGVGTGVYYARLLCDEPAVLERAGAPPSLPVARAAADRVLSLPVHPFLAEGGPRRIATAIAAFRS